MPNFDETTGIRYGVISPHSISSNCDYDLYEGPNSTDPHYESMRTEISLSVNELMNNTNYNISDDLKEQIKDMILDEMSERYDNPDGQMDYSDNEYSLHVSGDNFGIFVMKSPYYTFCRGCSPCAPGAGDLDASFDPDEHEITEGYHRALCLGHEWFDQSDDQYSRKIPYQVFRVSNDTEVLPGEQS